MVVHLFCPLNSHPKYKCQCLFILNCWLCQVFFVCDINRSTLMHLISLLAATLCIDSGPSKSFICSYYFYINFVSVCNAKHVCYSRNANLYKRPNSFRSRFNHSAHWPDGFRWMSCHFVLHKTNEVHFLFNKENKSEKKSERREKKEKKLKKEKVNESEKKHRS